MERDHKIIISVLVFITVVLLYKMFAGGMEFYDATSGDAVLNNCAALSANYCSGHKQQNNTDFKLVRQILNECGGQYKLEKAEPECAVRPWMVKRSEDVMLHPIRKVVMPPLNFPPI